MEIWKQIQGYNNYYISNYGNVKSFNKFVNGLILKTFTSKNGYERIELSNNTNAKKFLMHRLVAIHFIPNPENKKVINHKDGNKLNNHHTNLEWVTQSENIIHAFENKLSSPNKGEKHYNSKLTTKQVIEIYYLSNSRKFTNIELSIKYNVSKYRIIDIRYKRGWKHITQDL